MLIILQQQVSKILDGSQHKQIKYNDFNSLPFLKAMNVEHVQIHEIGFLLPNGLALLSMNNVILKNCIQGLQPTQQY